MEPQNERLAVVETKLDTVISLLEGHIEDPCGKCELSDDVAICQNDVKWMKRIGYTVGGLASASIVAFLCDKFTTWLT